MEGKACHTFGRQIILEIDTMIFKIALLELGLFNKAGGLGIAQRIYGYTWAAIYSVLWRLTSPLESHHVCSPKGQLYSQQL